MVLSLHQQQQRHQLELVGNANTLAPNQDLGAPQTLGVGSSSLCLMCHGVMLVLAKVRKTTALGKGPLTRIPAWSLPRSVGLGRLFIVSVLQLLHGLVVGSGWGAGGDYMNCVLPTPSFIY